MSQRYQRPVWILILNNRAKEGDDMQLTEDEAKDFFTQFFMGEHHIPIGMKEYGHGWCVNTKDNLATFDNDALTRLVLLAHEKCIRVELKEAGLAGIKIIIHKRQREGRIFERHPTIEQVI